VAIMVVGVGGAITEFYIRKVAEERFLLAQLTSHNLNTEFTML
jgi:hypothetical protein